MDGSATVEELKQRVREFCEARDWDQFHTPKDLAIGIITEASELLELFRFLSDEEGAILLDDPIRRKEIEAELADVLFFVVRFAQRFSIDLDDAIRQKMDLTGQKYPVERCRGSNVKYTRL